MRHCARSTYLPDLEWSPRYAYLANYSDGGELPDWGVAPTLCTPHRRTSRRRYTSRSSAARRIAASERPET